jgi:hypothetical protein
MRWPSNTDKDGCPDCKAWERFVYWVENHMIVGLGSSFMLFIVLLVYWIVTKDNSLQIAERAIEEACNNANEVRRELRGLMEQFRERVVFTPDLTYEQIERRIQDYTRIIEALPDRPCIPAK